MQTARLQALADADVAIRRGLAEAHHAAFCEAALVSVGRAKGSRMGDLARWLFRGCEVTGRMSLAISHAHLASLLGTRRQTITTKLAEMEGMNLFATRRTLITVRDLAGLARIRISPLVRFLPGLGQGAARYRSGSPQSRGRRTGRRLAEGRHGRDWSRLGTGWRFAGCFIWGSGDARHAIVSSFYFPGCPDRLLGSRNGVTRLLAVSLVFILTHFPFCADPDRAGEEFVGPGLRFLHLAPRASACGN